MALRLTGAGALLLLGLYAGGVLFVVLAPGLRSLPGAAYVRYWQALDADYGRSMPVLLLSCTALLVAAAFASRGHGWAVSGPLVTGTLLVVVTVVLTVTRMEPLNRVADGWDPDQLPADWVTVRDAWSRWHLVRTVLAVVAFACVLAGVLADGRPPGAGLAAVAGPGRPGV